MSTEVSVIIRLAKTSEMEKIFCLECEDVIFEANGEALPIIYPMMHSIGDLIDSIRETHIHEKDKIISGGLE